MRSLRKYNKLILRNNREMYQYYTGNHSVDFQSTICSVTFTMVVPHKEQLTKDKNIIELQNILATALFSLYFKTPLPLRVISRHQWCSLRSFWSIFFFFNFENLEKYICRCKHFKIWHMLWPYRICFVYNSQSYKIWLGAK